MAHTSEQYFCERLIAKKYGVWQSPFRQRDVCPVMYVKICSQIVSGPKLAGKNHSASSRTGPSANRELPMRKYFSKILKVPQRLSLSSPIHRRRTESLSGSNQYFQNFSSAERSTTSSSSTRIAQLRMTRADTSGRNKLPKRRLNRGAASSSRRFANSSRNSLALCAEIGARVRDPPFMLELGITALL